MDKPLVQRALSRLQAQHAVNSNLILYAIWLGQHQRGRLIKQDHKILFSTIHAWHERVLIPLQRLKQSVLEHVTLNQAAITKSIAIEIDKAEQIERCFIAEALSKLNDNKRNPAQRLGDACHNLMSYCRLLRIRIDDADQIAITHLLQSAFPNLIAAEIAEACEHALNPSATDTQFSQLSLDEL